LGVHSTIPAEQGFRRLDAGAAVLNRLVTRVRNPARQPAVRCDRGRSRQDAGRGSGRHRWPEQIMSTRTKKELFF